jgi:hypothetical protein
MKKLLEIFVSKLTGKKILHNLKNEKKIIITIILFIIIE